MKNSLIPNVDYYIDSEENLVFTKEYHLKRGYCCQSGCRHCPYIYKNKIDPNVPSELQSGWSDDVENDFLDDDEDL